MKLLTCLILLFSLVGCGVHVYHHHKGHFSPVFGPNPEYWAVKDSHLTCVCEPGNNVCGKKVAYEMLRRIKAGQIDFVHMTQEQCTRTEFAIAKELGCYYNPYNQ